MKTISWLGENGRLIILTFSSINFKCPYCGEKYSDANDKYLNKCNNNKSGCTKIKCSCGKRFGFTYDCKGDAITFELIRN